MASSITTYRKFLDSIQRSGASQLKAKTETIVEHFRPQHQPISRFAPVTFLLDYTSKKYLYVDETCFDMLGYRAEWFMETGIEEYISKWHPDDWRVINLKVFPENLLFIQNIPKEKYSDYIFSYNYRMITVAGEYITVLQRMSYIAGENDGIPEGVIGVVFNISHYKNDLSIIHTIEKSTSTPNGVYNELLLKKVYPLFNANHGRLSDRELEILRLLSEGCSSKQIAAKLSISINTVNNHRKNMLAKTGCKSSSELIKLAARHAMI